MKKALSILLVVGLLVFLGSNGWAEEAADTAGTSSTIQPIDMVWMLIAAFLVFFMQAGFAMVELGFTRAKNAGNIIMKNMMDFSVGSLMFWAVGFGLMFGADRAGLLGTSGFFLSTGDPGSDEGLWQIGFWLFQTVFAATAATIVSGAMAERTKFIGYLLYSAGITTFIYPIVGHWIWGGGWLSSMGMIDFAGSTVVHSVGGWAALAGAIVLGPRYGKYGPDGKAKAIPGHNVPLAALGVFILWFGWFGFNPGSTVSGSTLSIATIAVTTNLAAAAGAVAAMTTVWIMHGKPDTSMTLNGALAGLVGITAGCAVVSPFAAIVIGFIAGILVVLSVELIDKVLKIDDPVGAISVHGVCGAFGTLAVGLFANPAYGVSSGVGDAAGLFYGGGLAVLGTQLIGVVATFAWTFGLAMGIFLLIKATVGLRASQEDELRGLDLTEHATEAYSGFQIFITQ